MFKKIRKWLFKRKRITLIEGNTVINSKGVGILIQDDKNDDEDQ